MASLVPLIILPEHRIALPPAGGHPTQADVWVLARHAGGLAGIAVEAKVDESFGPSLKRWLADASPGKRERLAHLKDKLGLAGELPGDLRYQLLHRVAGAVVEAERFRADVAVCVVQSFDPAHAGLADFQRFAALFGQRAQVGRFVPILRREGMTALVGWVHHAPSAKAGVKRRGSAARSARQ